MQHEHAGRQADGQFVVLSVSHRVRNNLSADAQAGLMHLLGPGTLQGDESRALANEKAESVYWRLPVCHFCACLGRCRARHRRLHPRSDDC